MIAVPARLPLTGAGANGRALRRSAELPVGLALVVMARWAATRAGLDPLVVGVGFGVGLGVLALVAVDRPRRFGVDRLTAAGRPGRLVRSIALGSVVGLGLIAVAVIGPALAGRSIVPGLARPAAPFVPWALVIVIVAVAEEAVLRGALFERLRSLSGPALAVIATSVAFALMHVPLYGWHVVPLDLAVGCCLGGLRLLSRGFAAPAAAHAVADLATWWL